MTPAPITLPAPAPMPVLVPLPPLVEIICQRCANDGGCELCGCLGTIHVCSGCGEIPGVVSGLDACGCGVALTEML